MKSDKEMFFEKIVEENKNIIYTICYMFSKNNDEIADLFQSVLINTWYGLGSFRNESKIKTWIYRIALNTCISLERKKKKISTIPLETDINLFEDKDEDTKQIQMLYNRISKLGVLTGLSYFFGWKTRVMKILRQSWVSVSKTFPFVW